MSRNPLYEIKLSIDRQSEAYIRWRYMVLRIKAQIEI